jgi:hypothetical protein
MKFGPARRRAASEGGPQDVESDGEAELDA